MNTTIVKIAGLLSIISVQINCANIKISSTPPNAEIFTKHLEEQAGWLTGKNTPASFSSAGNGPYFQVKWDDGTFSEWKSVGGFYSGGNLFFTKPDNLNNYETNKPQFIDQLFIFENITSSPSNSEIYWGDTDSSLSYSGYNTPFIKKYNRSASYIPSLYYQVRKEGFIDSDIRYAPQSSTDRNINFELIKSTFAYLKLSSNEKNVDIYIDGALIGQLQGITPFNKKVPAGEHTIMVKKRFYQPLTIKVQLDDKDVFTYNFKLVKASGWNEKQAGEGKIIQAKGNLTIVTERNDLKVIIEGIEKIPPFELKNIAAGIYDIKIIGPHINKSIKQVVNEGENIFIDLDEVIQ